MTQNPEFGEESKEANESRGELMVVDRGRAIQSTGVTPLAIAGQAANRAAGESLFQRYLQEKSLNTIKRHARDLELFAEYLIDARIPLVNGANFQEEPLASKGLSNGCFKKGMPLLRSTPGCPQCGPMPRWRSKRVR